MIGRILLALVALAFLAGAVQWGWDMRHRIRERGWADWVEAVWVPVACLACYAVLFGWVAVR